MKKNIQSWGNLGKIEHDVFVAHDNKSISKSVISFSKPYLSHGLGRSYGDVAHNSNLSLLETTELNNIHLFNKETGILKSEAGLSINELLKISIPYGWFIPVSPGTKFVTLGGAVANDIHGKNHLKYGTIGNHIISIELMRSNGDIHILSNTENIDLFEATIGGLGLTGVILSVTMQLKPITSADFDVETLRMNSLDDFFKFNEEGNDWDYTVAWVDCFANESELGKGLYTRARHKEHGNRQVHKNSQKAVIPFNLPMSLLNFYSVKLFNFLYGNNPYAIGLKSIHYDSFLYPLDKIGHWNRLYGKKGFYQHQSVIPPLKAYETVKKLLLEINHHKQGSFLIVLKSFGKIESRGLISFPTEGTTLAIDIPNLGEKTLKLLKSMEDIVLSAGGRIYPAKDATMSADTFKVSYPSWFELEKMRDPAILSDFWRRVTGIKE